MLPENVTIICGKPPYRKDWAGGLDESFSGLILLGFHSKSGTGELLHHSYEPDIKDLILNGVSVGEIGIEAAIASIEALDIFATDPYWEIPLFGVQEEMKPFVEEQTLRCKNLAQLNGKKSEIWVQSWSMPRGRESEVYQAAKLIASLGVDRINACSYREYLAFGLTHDPETCWQNLKKAYKEIKNA